MPGRLPDTQLIVREGLIDLTWGHPDPALLPAAALARAAAEALADGGLTALPYGAEQGPGRLIELLCARMARDEGQAPDPGHVVISGGTSQALDHLCTLLTRPGEAVLVEAPTYHLALRILADHGLHLAAVAADEQGMRLDALEAVLAELGQRGQRASMLYTVPTYCNPSGAVMGLERRRALVETAAAAGLTVVEDDAYREIYFAEAPPPALATLYPEWPVVRLCSLAKCLAPGLRLGWMVAPPQLVLRWRRSGLLDSGGGVNHFTACVVAALLSAGELDTHVARLRAAYRLRRDTLVNALETYLPAGCSHNAVDGGFFVWVTLPAGYDAASMLPIAEALGVSYLPGERFFAEGGGANHLRLSFSLLPLEQLVEGARRLGKALDRV